MGARCSRCSKHRLGAFSEPVILNIYNLGTSGRGEVLNQILKPLGMGAFHCGVQLYNLEWSFSDTSHLPHASTGVFCTRPRECEGHSYCSSEMLGVTRTSEYDVLDYMQVLEKKWPGTEYDVLKRNCCHFCEELCILLGVGDLPEWIMRLATTGDYLDKRREALTDMFMTRVLDTFCCKSCHAAPSVRVETVQAMEPSYSAYQSPHQSPVKMSL
mmetsp:Transcript_120633/g.341750  ORF Transcript_120633/g.341750 Transcript_120633/m.341750 type:complete len:214 (+) Transcript_120633:116-757(+)